MKFFSFEFGFLDNLKPCGGGIFVYEEDVDNADWLEQKCSLRRVVLAARTHTEPDYTATATGQLNALVHLKKKNVTIGQWRRQNITMMMSRMLKILIVALFICAIFS